MEPLTALLEKVRASAQPGVWDRGLAMFASGAVSHRWRKDKLWFATVQGSRPYAVGFDPGMGQAAAYCECPFTHRGWCKHLIAAGLEADAQPGGWANMPAPFLPLTLAPHRIGPWLTSTAAPSFAPFLAQLEAEGRWLDALAWRLAHFEAEGLSSRRPLSAYGPPFLPDAFPSGLRKQALTLLFDRQQGLELTAQELPSLAAHRYPAADLVLWARLIAASDGIALHFAQTRAQGLGLPWP